MTDEAMSELEVKRVKAIQCFAMGIINEMMPRDPRLRELLKVNSPYSREDVLLIGAQYALAAIVTFSMEEVARLHRELNAGDVEAARKIVSVDGSVKH